MVIKLDGIDKSNSIIKYKKIDNNSYKNLSDFNKELTLETGIYEFEINSYFKEKKWSFEILFNENGKYKSAFDEKNIFYDLSHKNIKIIFFYNLIGSLFDYLVLLSIIYLITKLILIYSLNIPILIFSSLFLIVNLLFFKINSVIQFDKYGSFGLAIFLFVSLIIYLLKIYNFNKLNVKSFYLLISIFIIIFFSWMNFDNIENIKWFSYHDDWETFQVLARLIAVDNSWVLFEERETIRRYGIRFLIAFLHIIFGKSFFPQQLFEVWAIILSAFLFYKILIFSKINNKISLTFSLLLLIIFFGENFRWLIGRGLTEFYSLSLVMMTAYLFSKNKDLNNFSLKNIILPCLLGFLIVVFREDQIIIASSLIFFAIYKIYGLNIFKLFMNIFKKKYKILSFYYFFLMSGITLIMLKNFLSFGDVSISQDAFHYKFEAFKRMIFLNYEIKHSPLIGLGLDFNNVASNIDKIHYLDDLYRFFTASDPYHVPRPTSLFLILGFLSSFYFIFNLKKYKYLNLGIVLVPIVCLLNPLLFFNHAYNPRYIISYLPFALMSTCFFLKIINEKYNLRKVYKKLF